MLACFESFFLFLIACPEGSTFTEEDINNCVCDVRTNLFNNLDLTCAGKNIDFSYIIQNIVLAPMKCHSQWEQHGTNYLVYHDHFKQETCA